MRLNDKYIEILEDLNTVTGEVPQIIRVQVVNDSAAEQAYNKYRPTFNKHTAKLVEMRHNDNPSLNQPCKKYDITNGRVVR